MKWRSRLKFVAILLLAVIACHAERAAAQGQRSIDDLIDFSKFHAEEQFDQMIDGGLLMALSDADQKWLKDSIDKARSQIDDYYSKLKTTHQPASRYNEMDISDTSDGFPFNTAVSLQTQRGDLKNQLEPGFRYCSNLFDMAVMSPDPLGGWFFKLKVPDAVVTKLSSDIAVEVKQVNDEGAKISGAKNEQAATLEFYKKRVAARHKIVQLIVTALSADERKSLAALMEEPDNRFLIADSLQRRLFRDERKWAKFEIPAGALCNSDSGFSNPLDADQRISLVRSEDKKIIATVDARKGQLPGFTADQFHGGLTASLDDQEVAIEPGKYVYYWIKADPKTPLVSLPVIPPFAATQP